MAPSPEIPKTMKAVQVTAYNEPYKLNTSVPVPDPSTLGPHDLLVKIAAASHCHTDEMVRSGVFGTELPCTGSHEGAGTVVAVGGSSSSSSGTSGGDGGSGTTASGDASGTAATGGYHHPQSGSPSAGGVEAMTPVNISASGATTTTTTTTTLPGRSVAATSTDGKSTSAGGVEAFTPVNTTAEHSTPIAPGSSSTTTTPSAQRPFRVGDRVMCGLPFHPCGSCADCIGGPDSLRRGQYCTNLQGHVGVHLPGNFAEYVVVDARSTTHLPDAITFTSAAPLACAGRTVWRGVTTCGLTRGVAGQWLAIVGAGGGLGHLGVQFARGMGFNVVAVDARDDGLEVTRKLRDQQKKTTKGSTAGGGGGGGGGMFTTEVVVIDARDGKDSVVEQVRAVTAGLGADATLNLSDSPDAAALSAAVTRMHGTMVQIAQPENVSVPFQELVFRDIRVRGSLLCSAEESAEMVAFIAEQGGEARGGVVVEKNVFWGLEKLVAEGAEGKGKGEVMELVGGGKIRGKAVVVVDAEQVKGDDRIGAKY
ncbi:hypothetical protein Micbo1qcDRAFT_210721 [Microdochium bolleyi]|uniref:Chaperonin 10-like protein n=1 Tax=Microdochium bolleyi TaxID=196109 RepID=A0A136JH32_9PEZI|nr:hypothetical protein Micbo1qcDRAFT_210721 [Microdochium bolleyi]